MTLAAAVVVVFGCAEASEGQRDGIARDGDRNRFERPIDDLPLTALPGAVAAPPDKQA